MATTEGWDKPLYRELPPLFSAHSGTSSQKGDAMTTKPDLPIIPFASRDAWEAWLEEHHATSDGLWLTSRSWAMRAISPAPTWTLRTFFPYLTLR